MGLTLKLGGLVMYSRNMATRRVQVRLVAVGSTIR